jgi:GTPase
LKFVDQVRIKVASGHGGSGCVSFRREAYVPKGGPDGGDGGAGGSVIILADSALNTLLDCQYQQLYRAKNGGHGRGSKCQGRSAEDLIVKVPAGTQVWDDESGDLVADLDHHSQQVCVAKGGRGGRGNARFVTSRNRAPRYFQEGEPGEEKLLRLELKLIADLGLVGLPNSGKSTLISKVSNARPKVADYPFTTKVPALGVIRISSQLTMIMADIPGLVEDAHQGAGMGMRFLRHIERTRVLLHLIDPNPILTPSAEERFDIIMKELGSYSPNLLRRPMIAVITKLDLPENGPAAEQLKPWLEAKGMNVLEISAHTGLGIKDLLREAARLLKQTDNEHESL